MKAYFKKFAHLLHDTAFDAEVMSAVALFGWAVSLLAGFVRFENSRGYAFFAVIGPEWEWGLVLLFVALLQVAAVATKRSELRKTASLLAAIMWGIVAMSIYKGVGFNTGLIMYPMLVLAMAKARARMATYESD